MRLFRWAVRLLPSRDTAVRIATGAWRAVIFLWGFVTSPGGLMVSGIALVTAGAWQVSPPAALIVAGLLLVRDAERPEPTKQ